MLTALFTAAAICCLTIILIRKWKGSSSSSSSGRSGRPVKSVRRLPLIGSLPFLLPPIERMLQRQYGEEDVVLAYYGLKRVYFLNSYRALKEALLNEGDKFLARPVSMITQMLTGEQGGIIMTNGDQWKDYRRFSLRTLRDFGFGRRGAEEIIQFEARALCSSIDEANLQPVDTAVEFSTSISNVICQFVFGSRLASEEPKFGRIREIFQKMTQSQSNFNLVMFFLLNSEYFVFLPPLFKLMNFIRRDRIGAFKELTNFCREQLEKHRVEMHEGDQPRDFIEAHLRHQETHSGFNDVRLTLSIADLFLAGTDTTSHSLRWAVIFMVENPQVAETVFQEINSQIGTERQVTAADKTQLNYTMATIEEINRMACLVPLGLFHCATADAEVCGVKIEVGDTVMYNMLNIHHNPSVFPQPEQFRPQRFLDEQGRFCPHEHVVPFGIGKRACLGEALARMELFVFFVTLVQRYRFSLDPQETRSLQEIKDNPQQQGGGIRAPGQHRILFTRR